MQVVVVVVVVVAAAAAVVVVVVVVGVYTSYMNFTCEVSGLTAWSENCK
jgi:hypothetical protein